MTATRLGCERQHDHEPVALLTEPEQRSLLAYHQPDERPCGDGDAGDRRQPVAQYAHPSGWPDRNEEKQAQSGCRDEVHQEQRPIVGMAE